MGNEPVKEWLLSLEKEDRRTIGADIQEVELGYPIGMPLVRKLDAKHKLLEVRSKLDSDKIARVIFTIYKERMILLHGFIKKDRKTPQKELDVAIKRLKDIKLGDLNG